MLRYCKLWSAFEEKEFTHWQAAKALSENETLGVILSAVRKAGWLETKLDPNDLRKRVYTLKSPEEVVKEITRDERS
jgi:type I restriction enzyme M protein